MTDKFEKEWSREEPDFEIPKDILEDAFSELHPEAMVDGLNPCTIGMNRIITGIALSCITLNFLALNSILPAIGAVLLLLGFRNLRGENVWFRIGYVCAILRLITFVPVLILNATVYNDVLNGTPGKAVSIVLSGIQIVMLFAFWRAINRVQEKAGIQEKSSGAGALFAWYVLLMAAAATKFYGTVSAILMLIAFIMIIVCLVHLSKLMGSTGYVITATPLRVDDGILSKVIAGVIIVGIMSGYAFFSSYHMSWEKADHSETGSGEIYHRLVELGYPEEQLRDLSKEELELLKDADLVVSLTDEEPLNNGVQVTEQEGGGTQIYTDYPIKELKLTHVAVRIAGDGSRGEVWRVIHHFQLDDALKVRGTANLQLWPLETSEGWKGTEDLSGRLFGTVKGEDLTADYYYLGKMSYASTDFFGNQRTATDCMCDFSMPKKATNRRGYVAYTSEQIEDGYLLNAWINYTNQAGFVQYPVKTADYYVREGMHIRDYPFITVQSALQFYVKDGVPEF